MAGGLLKPKRFSAAGLNSTLPPPASMMTIASRDESMTARFSASLSRRAHPARTCPVMSRATEAAPTTYPSGPGIGERFSATRRRLFFAMRSVTSPATRSPCLSLTSKVRISSLPSGGAMIEMCRHGLIGHVPEHPGCGVVPALDDPFEELTDDRLFGRLDDRRE